MCHLRELVLDSLLVLVVSSRSLLFRGLGLGSLLLLDKIVQRRKRKEDAIDKESLNPNESPEMAEGPGTLLLPLPGRLPLRKMRPEQNSAVD